MPHCHVADDLAGLALAAEGDVVVQVQDVGERTDIVPIPGTSLYHLGDPLVAGGAAGAILLQPLRPGEDLVGKI